MTGFLDPLDHLRTTPFVLKTWLNTEVIMRKGKMPPVPYGGWVVSVCPDWCPSALLRVPHQPRNPRITGLVLTPNQKASGEATNVLSLSGETKNHSAEPRVREGMLRNFQVHK